MKYFFYLIFGTCLFLLGFYFGKQYKQSSNISSTEQSVLLERIREVFKIVYVEAKFSELINHKDYSWFDLSPFRKTAIIRVQATVHAGLNMDSSKIQIDEATKTIHFYLDTTPVILSMEHTMDYYDLQQGSFNYFKPEELSHLETNALNYIRKKAEQSDLVIRCSAKRTEMMYLLHQLAQTMNYRLEVHPVKIKQPPAIQ